MPYPADRKRPHYYLRLLRRRHDRPLPSVTLSTEAIRGAFSPFTDQAGQDIEVRPHEKGLAGSLTEVPIVAVDHGPYRPDAGGYRIGDEITEIGWWVLTEPRIPGNGVRNAFGCGAHQWLHGGVLLLRGDLRPQSLRLEGGAGRDAHDERGTRKRSKKHSILPQPS